MIPGPGVVLALAGIAACATGCMFARWNVPRPFVRAGAAVFHVKQVRQRETSGWTRKSGTQVDVTVLATKYTTIDLQTCRVVSTATFDGAARELAWDPASDDVWVALDSERGTARSLRGRKVDLPDALRAHSEDWLTLPSNRIARDPADGTLWLWRVPSGSVDIVARQAPPLEASASLGTRSVAVTRSGSPAEVEVFTVDDAGAGVSPRTARRRLPVSAAAASSMHLVGQGRALAFLGQETVDVFDLADGSRLRRIDLPRGGAVAWSVLQPALLAFAPPDRGPGCSSQLTVVDLERDVSRSATLSICPSTLTWLGPSPWLLAERRAEAVLADRWVVDPGRAVTIPAATTGRSWQALDDLVVFLDGPESGRRAMASTPARPVPEALSDQARVRSVSVEPISRSVVIASESGDVAIYRADARRLDHCDVF